MPISISEGQVANGGRSLGMVVVLCTTTTQQSGGVGGQWLHTPFIVFTPSVMRVPTANQLMPFHTTQKTNIKSKPPVPIASLGV